MPTRIPPHDDDAEAAVLGSILIDKEAFSFAAELVKSESFYKDNNREIFDAMAQLYEERKPIDLITLTSKLKNRKTYEKVGGAAYLTGLANETPTAANVEHYALILREKYLRRSLIHLAGQITEQSFEDDGETPTLLDTIEQSIFSISQHRINQGFAHIKHSLAESFDRLDELHKSGGSFRGIETGFTDIDFLLSGLQPSNLVVLAARPGTGKTAFVVNVAQYIAVQSKIPVGIFSLEMSKEELVDRLLISQSDIDAWRLKTGRLSEDDFEKLSTAMGELADAPIYIDDTPGITISEIRTKARRLQLESGIKLIIIDYLQLINPGKKIENRVQEVTYISQNLKNLARELKIPVIAVSQLSRAVEHRGERRPQLADLRESGAIEQDADVVMFLYNKEEEFTSQRIVSVNIAKHRNGPTGEKDLLFRGDRIRFYNIEGSREEETPPPTLQN